MDTITELLTKDQKMRVELTKNSFFYFFHVYFNHYVTYPTAQFQKEIISLLKDEKIPNIFITAFRGSGKSTFISLAYVIWAIVGRHNKRFVIMASQVQAQSQLLLSNIKREFESNELLKKDFGLFYEDSEEWRSGTLVLSKYDARISVVSINESIRGPRHKELRPDLIIFDDVENLESTKNIETRNATWHYINSELFPLGDTYTRRIGIGNLIHPDSTMVRFKQSVLQNRMLGIYKEYPLITDDGIIMWPEKFPNMAKVEDFKRKVTANEADWLREYLLKIVPDGEPLISIDDITFYSENEMDNRFDFLFYAIGVDPAVSSSNTADKSAIIACKVFGDKDKLKIYVLPRIINRRMEMPELIQTIKNVFTQYEVGQTRVFIESVALQKGIAQMLQHENVPAEEITVSGQDKRTRLSHASTLVKKEQLVFPNHGAEELIQQVTLFGSERYDDLVDALTLVVNKVISLDVKPKNEVRLIPLIDSRADLLVSKTDWADEEDDEMFRELGWTNRRKLNY